jgi:hypothetical protein
MTSPRNKSEVLSETAKTYLKELWIEKEYNRRKEIHSKYMEKGTMVEEEALTLFTEVTGQFYKKNEKDFYNDFLTGTPDIFPGLVDIKSCWDLWTFQDFDADKYFWQMQGYMWLTGEKSAVVAACLIDTPFHLIADEQRKWTWRNGIIDPDSEAAQAGLMEIEKNMTFSDIPQELRVKKYNFEFDETVPSRVEEKYYHAVEYFNQITL